jgi:DNA primase
LKTTHKHRALLGAARRLLSRPDLLYRVCEAVGRLGVVGEKRNRLVVFLAGITKELDEPVSVMVKGPSGSGKSNLLRTTLRLFPPNAVIERASLSGKVPAYAKKRLF